MVWIILSSITIAVLIFILTVIFKIYFARRDRHIARITQVFEKQLVSYLVGEKEDTEKVIPRIQVFARSKRNKNILIKLLLNLNHNFSGVYSDKVFDLYEKLNLHKVSLAKLKSRQWHQLIRGMYELSTLEYEDAFDEILKLINHQRADVRRNARISLVRVRKKEALMILKDLEGSMSTWTFINILASLKRHPVKLSTEELKALKSADNNYFKNLAKELETTVYVQ